MKILKILSIIIFFGCFFSCSSDDSDLRKEKQRGYSFIAEIEDFETFFTRANRRDAGEDDEWTVESFSKGDFVGFYSQFGNEDAPDGNGTFENVKMEYGQKDGSMFFYNNDIAYNTDYFKPNSTFYYYPYSPNMSYDPSHIDYDEDDDYGMELRVSGVDSKGNQVERCEDIIWFYSATTAAGTVRLSHAFSSIVFIRGKGFSKAKNRKITVVLEKPVSHLTIADGTDSYYKNVRPIYLKGYRTEEECRRWEAWEGGPYTVVDKTNPSLLDKTFDDAQYVILPTMRTGERLSVDHIELYDDDDKLQILTNFTLYTSGRSTKILYYGHRYPLLIKMEELAPVVYPIGIEPWDEDEDNLIEDNRAPGISSTQEFQEWYLNYNTYISNGRVASESVLKTLEKYGDRTILESDNSEKWKFYINNNLDLSGLISSGTIIPLLQDCIEGNNHSISGLVMEFTDEPGAFIGELGSSGIIQNLNFRGLNMSSNGSKEQKAGGLFITCKGTVDNCDVDGVVNANGPVGLLAAEADGAVIKNCVLRGLIMGSSALPNKLFASMQDNCSFINNNSSGLIFQNK